MKDCLFCKIGKKEIDSKIIYEDNQVLAFLDVNPLTKGHVLVIPKNHAANILELTDGDLIAVFRAARLVANKLNESLKPSGFTMGVNHGKISGQSVDHFHLHLIPRFQGDGGGSLHLVVQSPPEETLDEVQQQIIKIKEENKNQ